MSMTLEGRAMSIADAASEGRPMSALEAYALRHIREAVADVAAERDVARAEVERLKSVVNKLLLGEAELSASRDALRAEVERLKAENEFEKSSRDYLRAENEQMHRIIDAVFSPKPDSAFPQEVGWRRKAVDAIEANGWLRPEEVTKLTRERDEAVAKERRINDEWNSFMDAVRVPCPHIAKSEADAKRIAELEAEVAKLKSLREEDAGYRVKDLRDLLAAKADGVALRAALKRVLACDECKVEGLIVSWPADCDTRGCAHWPDLQVYLTAHPGAALAERMGRMEAFVKAFDEWRKAAPCDCSCAMCEHLNVARRALDAKGAK